MPLAAPGLLELRAEGDEKEDGQSTYSVDHQVEQLARSRIDPMRILNNHQNGVHSRQRFELM